MVMRLDQYLVQHHNFTRNKAQQLISSDLILVNSKICNKTSQSISESDIVIIREDRRIYWVSRSAEKLEGFLELLTIPLDL
jgi:predicted rRNA methylase YqxC with S4 and FtsJ domains